MLPRVNCNHSHGTVKCFILNQNIFCTWGMFLFLISSHEHNGLGVIQTVLTSGGISQKKKEKKGLINLDRITPHHVHEMNYLENIWSMLLDCKWFCLWATFKLRGIHGLSIWMNDWILTLPYFNMTYNIKIEKLKDIILSPFPPNKRQSKKLLPFDKSRNGHDQENSYYTINNITEYGQSLCVSEYPTLSKSRDLLVWCSKRRKRQNTELYWLFQNPKIALIISLMLWDYW